MKSDLNNHPSDVIDSKIDKKLLINIPNVKSIILKMLSYYQEFELDNNITGNESIFKEIMKYRESLKEYINLEIRLMLEDCYLRNSEKYINYDLENLKSVHEKILMKYTERVIGIKINKIFEKYGSPYRCPENGLTLIENIRFFSFRIGEVFGIVFR